MKVTPLNLRHRGFELGYCVGLHGYTACWRSSLKTGWQNGWFYVETVEEVPRLARGCIDVQCRSEAHEAALGRPMTMAEYCEWSKADMAEHGSASKGKENR